MKRWIFILIASSIVSMPFYMSQSGLPQISDLLILCALVLFIFNYRVQVDKVFILVLIITALIALINLSWSILYSNLDFVPSIAYYAFNFMFLIMIINLYNIHRYELLEVIYKSIVISVILQVIISPFIIDSSLTRQTLLFNNPNQLGYFALLAFSIVTIIYFVLKRNILAYLIISGMILYLALLSNSSAAIVSIILILTMQFLVIFIFKFDVIKKGLSVLILALLTFFLINISTSFNEIGLLDNVLDRYTHKSEKTQSVFEERGYDRILENPQYLILGAGEGLIQERFSRIEIHSTIFAFLFNYGIVTTFLFIILLLTLLKKPSILAITVFVAIHFYGITHNGIRQPLFWLLSGIIYVLNIEDKLSLKYILTKDYFLRLNTHVNSKTE